MVTPTNNDDLAQQVRKFVRRGFKPSFDRLADRFADNGIWAKLNQLGTELWLDTGSISDAQALWNRRFSALTTNNTLLNREVQTGIYDDLIIEAYQMLTAFSTLSQSERILEISFILNAHHALRLVEKFDAYVSVEEHTDLACDVERAVYYAKRFYEICPERFIIKIPFTPAGLLATRKLSAQQIPINHTLGFSARQNYLIAAIGNPAYVNVFLGRLNSFVKDNNLGTGMYVGEKATLASQKAIRQLRKDHAIKTKQIAASLRNGKQVDLLAGVDVMTMPPKVALEFLDMSMVPNEITDKTTSVYTAEIDSPLDEKRFRLNTLWDVDDKIIAAVDALEKEDLDNFPPETLIEFFQDHQCADVLVPWTEQQRKISMTEGKIPKLENWKDILVTKKIGLDSLMNLAGLSSFTSDQIAMDERVKHVLQKAGLSS